MWVQLFQHLLSSTSFVFSVFVRDINLPSLKLRSEYYRLKDEYIIAFSFCSYIVHIYPSQSQGRTSVESI